MKELEGGGEKKSHVIAESNTVLESDFLVAVSAGVSLFLTEGWAPFVLDAVDDDAMLCTLSLLVS